MPSALKSDLILGIESSCDETAAAVLRGPKRILSNVIASQVPIHRRWGGVVPELASRQHILSIDTVVGDALQKSGVGLDDLGGVAVTYGPGLVGSLLVGISVAKAIAMVRQLPLAAVNHIEGHIQSIFMEPDEVPLPLMALIVSGGHTSLYLVEAQGRYRALAHTRDDAAGEAYDKVAKLLGLGYPGGPIIDRLAKRGDPKAVPFSRPRMTDRTLDFSFSGLKTAVLRWVQAHPEVRGGEPAGGPGLGFEPRMASRAETTGRPPSGSSGEPEPPSGEVSQHVLDLLASFQETLVRYLIDHSVKAARLHNARSLGMAGGVACNSLLRERMRDAGAALGLPVFFPTPILTTDNAAMIAAAGWHHLQRGQTASSTLNSDPAARL